MGEQNKAAGENTLEVHGAGSQYGTQFWGSRVCSTFEHRQAGGTATYTLIPRRVKDVDGNWYLPANVISTLEVLRHTPEHAWIPKFS